MVEQQSKVDITEPLKKQVEFYLSEENLKHDKFFNDLARENKVFFPNLLHRAIFPLKQY